MLIKKIAVIALSVALALGMVAVPSRADITTSALSRVAGTFTANNYAWHGQVVQGNTSTGSVTVTLGPSLVSLPDGRQMSPFGPANNLLTPVSFDLGANNETVTPTAVSPITCPFTGQFSASATCISFTGTFANTHGLNATVASGSFGLQEAIVDAFFNNGGTVVIDNTWQGTNAMIVAATPFEYVTIADYRNGGEQFWSPQGAAAVLSTPATLTAVTALPSTTPVGTFTATNYNMCISYVDIEGQEGNCSITFVNAGAGATSSFIFSPPAASTGAVGYTIYIGLTGAGAGTLQYKVPLVSQPTVAGTYPASNGVCVLTKIETTTPACAVANTTYGQTGATATVTAITLATSPIQMYSSVVSTTAIHIPNPNGRQVYAYTPGSHIGFPGIPASSLVYPAAGSAASTVPTVIGTVNVPPQFMNYLGRTLEICGKFGINTGSTTTVLALSADWSSMGQDNAGLGVAVTNIGETPATAFATKELDSFCFDLQTTVTGVTATAGSINTTYGIMNTSGVVSAAAGQGGGADSIVGATGSLNLAVDSRINLVYTHTTGTFAPTLQNLTVKVVN